MIYRIEIENFFCIRDRQILDLTVPKTTPDNPERFAPIYSGSEFRAPKAIAIFGANGSGKSTVLRALSMIAWFVRDSFGYSQPSLPCQSFNDDESANRPIQLAVEFGGPMDLTRIALKMANDGESITQGVYRYELEFGVRENVVTTVNRETLKQKPNDRGKWRRVFERHVGDALVGSKSFPLSGLSKIVDKIRGNASVLATLALFEHEPSQILVEETRNIFSNILFDRTEISDAEIARFLANNPGMVTELNKDLQRIDVGIQEMRISQLPNGPAPFFVHEGLMQEMPWGLESHGTRSFIRIFPWVTMSLLKGGIAIIDELDLSIHPLILPEIVRWYYDQNRNPRNAQLWMTCQSASFMQDLVKEEIVLCEKDRQGKSSVYSLMDMKAVRRSDDLYRKYLGGLFGAIPHIG